jgi:hypothetical protein
MARKRTPTGLQDAGKALWRDIVGTYELRSDELRILEDTCREADLVARMQAEMDEPGFQFIVSGSMGQKVIHTIVSEIRQHRAVIQRFLAGLKLPDEPAGSDADGAEERSSSARRAANARWGNG